jgi:two-component sensor histidine kinase
MTLGLVDGERLPFAAYYPAILVVTLLGGVGPGWSAAVAGIALMWWNSVRSFACPGCDQLIYLAVHVAASAVTVWAAEAYRRVVQRLREEEAQRAFLMRELQHRGKNTFAVIQAIVNHALQRHREDSDKINQAIKALLVADDLLMHSENQTADLKELLLAKLEPYGTARITVSGDSVTLVPSLARAVALMFHELATNAAKYGALSAPAGSVLVSWTTSAGLIRIKWAEGGGPTVTTPVRHGFGSQLVERLVQSFGGTVYTDFHPNGLACEICLALCEAKPQRSQASPQPW